MNSASGGDILFHFKGDTSNLDNATKGISNGMKGMTSSILKATGITKAFSMTMDLVKGSTDQAISRLDTLNQFPKVMSNLGIGAEEAQASIDKMSEKLQGLPTTLDQGAMAVQRFTSKNGDVKKSTDMFLALNNAILAGGAGSEIQSSAIEQLSQAYAKGKMDMMEWRTIQMAMPAQLKQIASAMGMSTEQMGIFLREGDNTAEFMDEFMQTIQNLNEEGVNGFQNFEQQARNSTGGIQTSITVMKTRVAQGMAELIKSVDVGLKDFGGLSGVFTTIGDTLKSALKSLAPYVISTIQFLGNNLPTIISALKIIAPIVLAIASAFKIYSATVKIITTVTKIWTVAQALLNGTLLLNPIGLIVVAIVALIAILVLLYNKCEWFRNLVNGIFEFLKSGIQAIINFLTPIVQTIVSIVQQVLTALAPVINFIKMIVINYIKFYINMAITIIKGIITVIQSVINFARSIPGKVKNFVGKIVSFFANLPNNLLNIGKNMMMGLWNGIKGLKDWVIDKVKGIGKSILKGIKGVLGIHSPSTEFAMIGKFSVLGYTEQLDKMRNQLQEQVQDTFSLSPNLVGSMNNHFSPNVIVNNNVNMETDPLGQTVSRIKTFSGGAKNDYNYGMGV